MKIVNGTYKKQDFNTIVLALCTVCRDIQIYKVTDDVLQSSIWEGVGCAVCDGMCKICVLKNNQKPPGFAIECKKCDFRFVCASNDIKELETTWKSIHTFTYEEEV